VEKVEFGFVSVDKTPAEVQGREKEQFVII
jgi:hypothetical protein